jgi:hypothetical protein
VLYIAGKSYLSGRCSPFSRMWRIRSRYWYSSCRGEEFSRAISSPCFREIGVTNSGSVIEGAIVVFWGGCEVNAGCGKMLGEDDA